MFVSSAFCLLEHSVTLLTGGASVGCEPVLLHYVYETSLQFARMESVYNKWLVQLKRTFFFYPCVSSQVIFLIQRESLLGSYDQYMLVGCKHIMQCISL